MINTPSNIISFIIHVLRSVFFRIVNSFSALLVRQAVFIVFLSLIVLLIGRNTAVMGEDSQSLQNSFTAPSAENSPVVRNHASAKISPVPANSPIVNNNQKSNNSAFAEKSPKTRPGQSVNFSQPVREANSIPKTADKTAVSNKSQSTSRVQGAGKAADSILPTKSGQTGTVPNTAAEKNISTGKTSSTAISQAPKKNAATGHEVPSADPLPIKNEVRRTVWVGFYPLPGYHEIDKQGRRSGFGFDYLQHLQCYTPWHYEYTDSSLHWFEMLALLEEGKIDLVTNVRKTPEREEKFAFSRRPMGQVSNLLTVKAGNSQLKPGDYKNWSGIRVGMIRARSYNESFINFAEEKNFTFENFLFDDVKQLYDALQRGEIDAAFTSDMRQLGKEWVYEEIDVSPGYIAVNKKNKQLLAELDQAMLQLETQTPEFCQVLRNKYFSESQKDQIAYSPEELEFIRQCQASGKKFIAVLNPDRYPLSYCEGVNYKGIIKDLADEIIKRTGLNITFMPLKTNKDYENSLTNYNIDIIFDINADYFKAEELGFVLTEPYITEMVSVLHRRDFNDTPKTFSLIHNSYMADLIKDQVGKENISSCQSYKEVVDKVIGGQCDAAFLYLRHSEHLIQNDTKSELTADYLPGKNIKFSVGVRESLPHCLPAIINKAVLSIDNNFSIQSNMKYMANIDSPYTLKRLFRLYPWLFVGTPFLITLFLSVFFLYYLKSRKKEFQTGVIFNNLPIRYFVVDEYGNVLLSNLKEKHHLVSGSFSSLNDVVSESVRNIMSKKSVNVIKSGIPEVADYSITDDGTRSAMVSPLPQAAFGRPTAIWISQDISELQKTRDEVKKNEELYRLTLNSIGDAVFSTDSNGYINMINPAAEKLLGVKSKEVIGLSHEQVFRIFDTITGKKQKSPVDHVLRTNEMVELNNHTELLSMDGTHRYHIADSAAPIRDLQNNTIGVILVFRDVTTEYHRRNEIQNELANWETVVSMAKIYNFCFNINTFEVTGNSTISNVWPIVEGRAVPAQSWVYPDDLPNWKKAYDNVRKGSKKQEKFEYRVFQNGSMRYFQGFAQGNREHPEEIFGLVQEITDLVAEQKKQDSEQKLWKTCIDTVPAIIYIKSPKNGFRYVQCNANFANFFGKKQEEIIGHTDEEIFGKGKTALQFRKSDTEVIESGKPQELHEIVPDSNGLPHQFRATKVPVKDNDGDYLLFGISLDITEDYKLRIQLQTLLENWEIAADVAKIVTYRVNYNTMELTGNKQLPDFWPVKNGKAVPAKDWVHPKDVILCEQNYKALVSDQVPKTVFVYRVIKKDGTHFYRIYSHKVLGRSDEITGIIQDITPFITAQTQRDTVLTMWRKIVDSVPATFYIKDADDNFKYLQCNNHISEVFNYTPEEIIGHTDMELFLNPKDAKIVRNNDQKVMRSGQTQCLSELLTDSRGIIHRYESTKLPAKNESGHSVLIGMTLEVTELQELAEIRKIISYAFETLFTTEYVISGVRLILKKTCEYIGFSRAYVSYIDEETSTVRLFAHYIPDGIKPLFNDHVFPISEARKMVWFQSLLDSKRGDQFDFDFSKEEDRNKAEIHIPYILQNHKKFNITGTHINYISVDNKPWGSIGFITQNEKIKVLTKNEAGLLEMIGHIIELVIFRKQIISKLKAAVVEAQAADKAKSFFLASMSHEIRTPLNSVIGFADLLKDHTLDQHTQQEYLTNISFAGNALLQLVNDILDLSKLEAGQFVFVPEKTNLTVFFREIAALFSHIANQKNLSLSFYADSVPDIFVDQQRMRQILFNLVGNAIKFTIHGGIKIIADFNKTGPNEGTLNISVEDTGIGIASEDGKRLFEPFVQLTRMRGTNSVNNGTGLGLPIVKKMITQMGGTVTLASTPGKGSVFLLSIPKIKMEVSDSPVERLAAIPSLERLCPENEDPRILLVDDVPLNLRILTSMLKRLHIFCETAASGEEALEKLKKDKYNIVMTDLYMAEMSGEDLAKAIRANPEYAAMRIVLITAEHSKVSYDSAIFDRVLEKPISRDALYENIFGR